MSRILCGLLLMFQQITVFAGEWSKEPVTFLGIVVGSPISQFDKCKGLAPKVCISETTDVSVQLEHVSFLYVPHTLLAYHNNDNIWGVSIHVTPQYSTVLEHALITLYGDPERGAPSEWSGKNIHMIFTQDVAGAMAIIYDERLYLEFTNTNH